METGARGSAPAEASTEGPCPACGSATLTPVLRGPDRLYRTGGTFTVAECPACGTGTTFPRLGPQQLSAYYPPEYVAYEEVTPSRTAGLASAAIHRWQAWLDFRTPPLALFRELPIGRALDVGCGRGDLGAALVERGWQVAGVEPSAAACAQAKARGIDARCGTLATVPLETGSYDVAIFRQSLEHVPDPVEDLSLVRHALRPGGRVVVSVPDFGCWYRRAFGSRWFHLELPRHRVHFTRTGLDRTLRRAGFEPERVSKSTSTMGLPASVQYAVFGRCLFARGLAFRLAVTACLAVFPLAWLTDRLLRDGDGLHVVARRAG